MDTHNKAYLKIVQIARARVLGAAHNISDTELARQFGLSPSGFNRLIGSSEYKELEAQVLSTVTAKMDTNIDGNMDALKRKFSQGVPLAMQRILDIAMQTRDLRTALDASRELLDRDPNRTFAKGVVHSGGAGAQPLPQEVLSQLGAESADVVSEAMGKPVTQSVQ